MVATIYSVLEKQMLHIMDQTFLQQLQLWKELLLLTLYSIYTHFNTSTTDFF